MKRYGGREQESEVQGRGRQVTEGNLRQSTSEDIGDVFVSNVYFCLSLFPLLTTPSLFTKAIESGVRDSSVRKLKEDSDTEA